MESGLTKNKTFKCPVQSTKLARNFPNFREENLELDVILIALADTTRLRANRAILSVSSRYFSEIFSTVTETEIRIPHINGTDLKSIWKFMCTAAIELDCENVRSILIAAEFFRIRNLEKACTDFLEQRLDACNCLDVFFLADKYDLLSLKGTCLTYAYRKLHEICTKKTFLCLNEQQLNEFLHAAAQTSSQAQLFHSLLAWYRYDKTNRRNLMDNLMSQYINFELLEGKSIALEWNISYELPEVRKEKIILISYERYLPLPFSVQSFDTELDAWSSETWPTEVACRDISCMFLLNKRMFISGGLACSGDYSNSFEYFDIESKENRRLSPMLAARYGHSMVEIGGNLYVVGGVVDGHKDVSSVERYDFSTETWKMVSTLPKGFTYDKASAARGRLYVASRDKNYLACYEPSGNKWTSTPSMIKMLPNSTMTTVNGCVYIVGDTEACRYHPIKCKWTMIEYPIGMRKTMASTAWNDRLVIFGCYSMSPQVWFVVYDPKTKLWENIPALLPCNNIEGLAVHILIYK